MFNDAFGRVRDVNMGPLEAVVARSQAQLSSRLGGHDRPE